MTCPVLNPSGLCQCGCGQPAPRWKGSRPKDGQVKGEFARYIQYHYHAPHRAHHIDAATGCWIYEGALSADGYPGSIVVKGRCVRTTHWYYERAKGPIPAGLQLDHLCRNRACVNPDHLEAVTPAENTRRSPVMTKLTRAQVVVIKQRLAGGERPAVIQQSFPVVTRQLIAQIRIGRAWRDVLPEQVDLPS